MLFVPQIDIQILHELIEIWTRLVISISCALVSNLSQIVTSFEIYSYVTYIL